MNPGHSEKYYVVSLRVVAWIGAAVLGALPYTGSALAPAAADDAVISRLAFGSCAKQGQPQPIWEAIVATDPQVFLFIGDNIYGDSKDVAVLKAKWEQLGREPGYRKLRDQCPILATWDDHDYGWNDAGAEYPLKKESQRLFLDFFAEPHDSPRRRREGVYDAKVFGPPGRRVQVILLDTRYFRSPLVREFGPRRQEPGEGYDGQYVPNHDPRATILGDDQWKWLAEQLRVPAEVRVLASSIQVVADEHGWEKWGNFPAERARLFKLLTDTGAEGVVIISGDRHSAEISAADVGLGYRLFDVTSSSLNQPAKWHNEVNRHRIGTKYVETNFGTLLIDWEASDPLLRLQVRSEKGEVVLQQRFPLSALRRRGR